MRTPAPAGFHRAAGAALAAWLCTCAPAQAQAIGWPHYGNDAGGSRYSEAAEITPENVDGLRRQWTIRTGDAVSRSPELMRSVKFETTPILAAGRLVFCTPFSELVAADPATGAILWRHDPKVATDRKPANRYNCRGVAQWRDPAAAEGTACATRILGATVDARLIAVDATTGRRCEGFGAGGEVQIDPGPLQWPGEFQFSSAPVVAGEVLVVGSSINDNGRVAAPSGRVRAFDVRTGAPRWSWDPIPRAATDPAAASWGEGWREAGAANVWAPMSVDERRGLVFLPTSSPSPDFYGGLRPGDNVHADSVVALHAADGTIAWSFQVVRHDVWDYDLPAQPTLATIEVDGAARDVVVQATKQGFVFVLDRDTGRPVFPVELRPVPQGGAAGESLSPTQLFPVDLPPLVPQSLRAEDAFGLSPWSRADCRRRLEALRNDGLFTPPTRQGTVLFPFTGGGANWGGVAIDPAGVVYVNTSRAIHIVTLIPRDEYAAARAHEPGREFGPQAGAPYGMKREVMLSAIGVPCNPPPWGTIAALDLRTRRIAWESALGTTEDVLPLGIALATGTPNFGGPIVTRGGLVFIGAAMDRYLRAFDAHSGAELWRGRLPAPAMATPMTYVWQGRQYVVVAAGGHGEVGTKTGDTLVAFALPAAGEPHRSLWDRYVDQPGHHLIASALLILAGVGAGLAYLGVRRRRRRARQRPGAAA